MCVFQEIDMVTKHVSHGCMFRLTLFGQELSELHIDIMQLENSVFTLLQYDGHKCSHLNKNKPHLKVYLSV